MSKGDCPPARPCAGPGLLDRVFGDRAPAVRREIAARHKRARARSAAAMRDSEAKRPEVNGDARGEARPDEFAAERAFARRLIDSVAGMTEAERADLLRSLRPAVAEVVRDVLAADLPDVLAALLPPSKPSRKAKGVRQ